MFTVGVALSSVPHIRVAFVQGRLCHSVSHCRAYLDRGVCNCIEIARDSWSNPLGLSLNSSVTSAPMAICVRAKMIKVGMPCPSLEKQSMFIAFWLFPRPCCACRLFQLSSHHYTVYFGMLAWVKMPSSAKNYHVGFEASLVVRNQGTVHINMGASLAGVLL